MTSIQDVLLQNLVGYFPLNGDTLDPSPQRAASPPTAIGNGVQYAPGWNGEQVAELAATTGDFANLTFSAPLNMSANPQGVSVSFFVNQLTANGIFQGIYEAYGFVLVYNAVEIVTDYGPRGPSLGVSTAVALPLDRWVHLALSFDLPTQTLVLWVDGARVQTHKYSVYRGIDARVFKSATMQTLFDPLQVARYVFTQCAMTDEMAAYLACDLFRPEGPAVTGVDYLSVNLADGQATGISLPDSSLYCSEKGFTFSTWVNTGSLDIYFGDFSDEDGDSGVGAAPQPVAYLLEREGVLSLGLLEDGRPMATFYGSEDGAAEPTVVLTVTGVSNIPIDDWVYVTMTVDSETCRLYFDGREDGRGDFKTPSNAPATAALTFGRAYPKPFYSAEFYAVAMGPEDIARRMNQVASSDDQDLLVYYDFSTRPCTVTARAPGPQAQPTLPAGVNYAQYTNAAILAWNGYIDCGFPPQTDLSSSLTFEAWINPVATVGSNVIVSRYLAGQGFSLHLVDGTLTCEVAFGGRALTVSAIFPLPIDRWTQVGVTFDTANDFKVSLFVNGQVVGRQDEPNWAPLASKYTPLAVGARFGEGLEPTNPGAPYQTATAGFAGYVQRLTIFAGVVDPQNLYFQAPDQSLIVLYDWMFEGLSVTDLIGDQPATPQNGATIGEISAYITADATEKLSRRDFARGRPARWRGLDSPTLAVPFVPDEHRAALATPADNLNGRAVVEVGERRYFVAYGASEGSPGVVVLSAPTSDPTMIWISIALDIVQIILTLFGAGSPNQQKYIKAGEDMWQNPAVRVVVRSLTRFNPNQLPGATFSLFRTLYDAGSLRALIGAFDFSFFGILRLLALFAPWVGLLGIAAQLALAVADLVKQIEKLRPLSPDPALGAMVNKISTSVTGLPVLTVNGLATTVTVWLEGATDEPIKVTPRQTLFSCQPTSVVLAAFGQKQTFTVNVSVRPDTSAPTGSNALVFDTQIRAAAAEVSFDVQVTRPVAPEEIELKANDKGEYTGQFEITLSSEVKSDLTVTLTPENLGSAEMSFDPADPVIFTAGGAPDGGGTNPAPTRVTRSVTMKNAAAGQKATIELKANAVTNGDPGDEKATKISVTCASATEEAALTMMDASNGNCFFLQNTKIESGTGNKFVGNAMIDGGFKRTYRKFKAMNLLPMGKPLNVMICTHYDSDHIAGLLAFFADRPGQVQHVVFNPAPAVPQVELASAPRHIVFSVTQSAELAAAAAGILVSPHTASPPPSDGSKVANINLPTLDILYGGPTSVNWAANQDFPLDSVAVNRASIITLFKSNVSGSGFKVLFTGDGYNTGDKLDVTGWTPLSLPTLHFLQIPHHGSKANSDQTLYAAWKASNYLFSANGHTHVHPSSEVIEAIVMGNRAERRSGYALWFSASSFARSKPNDRPVMFPPMEGAGEYSVYMRRDGELGGTWTFVDEKVKQADPAQWEKMDIPLAASLTPYERVVIYEDQVLIEDVRFGRASARSV